jgi:hypothetical protein
MFGRLSWRPANRTEATINSYEREVVQLPKLTTSVFHLRADVMPPARQAKLVVGVESPKEMVGHRIGYAQYYQMVEPPLQGKVPPMEWLNLPAGSFNQVFDQRVASPGVETTDSNRATLFFANTSLGKDGPPISVSRWLLMAPEYIQYQRFQSGRYQIVWHETELKDDKDRSGRSAFAGYNVYAKRVSDMDFPPVPINAEPVTDEIYFDDTDGPQLWEYTTTVVDIYGNESEPAVFKLEGDPFEGVWEGKTRLIRGSISEPIIRTIRSRIANELVTGEVNNMINKAAVMLKNIDLLLRFGVSMTWEIKLEKGNLYTATPRTVLGRPVEDPEPLKMVRVGAFALAPQVEGKTITRGTLQLYRENEIRQSFEGTYNDPDIGSGTIGVRLAFTRRIQPAFDSHEVSR